MVIPVDMAVATITSAGTVAADTKQKNVVLRGGSVTSYSPRLWKVGFGRRPLTGYILQPLALQAA